jgi:hypothetical protein
LVDFVNRYDHGTYHLGEGWLAGTFVWRERDHSAVFPQHGTGGGVGQAGDGQHDRPIVDCRRGDIGQVDYGRWCLGRGQRRLETRGEPADYQHTVNLTAVDQPHGIGLCRLKLAAAAVSRDDCPGGPEPPAATGGNTGQIPAASGHAVPQRNLKGRLAVGDGPHELGQAPAGEAGRIGRGAGHEGNTGSSLNRSLQLADDCCQRAGNLVDAVAFNRCLQQPGGGNGLIVGQRQVQVVSRGG